MKETLLHVQNLNLHFGGLAALKNISLSVQKNSITALIGPNGAGKTTLFNCLTGFYTPSSGEFNYYDEHQQKIALHKLQGLPFTLKDIYLPHQLLQKLYYKIFGGSHLIALNGIARTFQNVRLFKEMSTIENLLVAQHSHLNRNLLEGLMNTKAFQKAEQRALEKAYHWLEFFDLKEDANTVATQLPYGKQRLLEIARAMCTNPRLICLDEPAAGLNPFETSHLCEKILTLREQFKVTVLLIEHDMSLVMKISDYIYVLDFGQIIATGKPIEIAENKKVIEAYLGVTH